MLAMLAMVFSRRLGYRMNRGRLPLDSIAGAPPFATISAPETADEGDDPAISAASADPLLSLTLVDVSPVVDVNIQTGVVSPYATTYPDITPGTRQVRFFNEANPSEFTSTASITVTPQAPILSAPADEASFTVGDIITFTADGTADGWDANTTKVDIILNGVTIMSIVAPTAGVWTGEWNSAGATPGTNLSVVARRYWVGLAGETGTVDSTVATDIDLVAAGGFDPLDIAGCVLWFDMQDAASYTQAGTVTSITNKASGVAWTEATNPPAYSAAGLSSQPCMDFNGTAQRIISTEAAVFAVLTNAGPYTLFFVGSHDIVDRNEAFLGVGDSGQAANRVRSWGQSTSSTGRYMNDFTNDAATTVVTVGTGQSDTSKHVWCWHSPGTTVSMNLDNAAANPAASAHNPATLTPNRTAIGCRPRQTPNAFFDGKGGEWILYNSELSGADITTVYNYLAARWP